MTNHPWLAPSAPLLARVLRARATAALRGLSRVPAKRLGAYGAAWSSLLGALPSLLRAAPAALFDAVGRVDVLPVLLDLADADVEPARLERALTTLWLALAGEPALGAPLALPGPFRGRVVDPRHPQLIELGAARALVAAAEGPVVLAEGGRASIDRFVVAPLPAIGGTVIAGEHLDVSRPDVVERATAALARVGAALPGGRLERLTIGSGDAALGEARVSPEVDVADVVASAEAAFVRAAAALEPMLEARNGAVVSDGRRLAPADVLARACGNAAALAFRSDRAAAERTLADDLDDLALLAEPTAAGAALLAAARERAGSGAPARRRVLLVNPDADDFVYSFLFGRSVERRSVERGLRLDRIGVRAGRRLDLASELGAPVPAPLADGLEILVDSESDPSLAAVLDRLSRRRYEAIVANVRPPLFYDLGERGFFASRVVLWDRHLHGGLREEGTRRGFDPRRLAGPSIRAWSLADRAGQGLQGQLAEAGLEHGSGRPWPIDLGLFRSSVTSEPRRLFAGGDNGRDWPVLVEAVRDLPIDVHLVTSGPPADLPPNVRAERRLTLAAFRDAIAAASIMALPLLPGVASGVTVLPIAMALGIPVVATRTLWIEQYVSDEEEALLAPPGDARAFRDRIARLLDDAELGRRLAANARRRVAELCDLDSFTAEMFAALDRMPDAG